jgi:alpha-tubulin suppressor-like RCC1 family protein/uncharacterized protein YjdB
MNRHLFIPTIACALLSCSSPTEPAAVASVSVSPTAITVASGATTTLSAATLDSKGNALTGRLISWASSDNTIATVGATGVVTAGMNRGGSPSTVTISASSEGKTGSAAIAVIPVPVSRVSFALDSVRLEPGAEQSPSISIVDTEGIALTGRTLAWTSNDTLVVKVSPAGVISAVPYTGAATREARIIAVAEGKADTLRAIVTPLAVARVLLSPDTVRLLAGATAQLMVVLQDSKATTLVNRSVSLNSQDTLIASASGTDWKLTTTTYLGELTRTTQVIAAAEGKADTSVIVVNPVPVRQVVIQEDSIALAPGMQRQLTAQARDSTGRTLSNRPLKWTSSDSSLVSISQQGLATPALSLANSDRTALIIAQSGAYMDTVHVRIVSSVNQVIASGGSHSCALADNGSAFCWGWNLYGQLGDGTTVSRSEPVAVSGNLSFSSIVSGNLHTCALTLLGRAYCWGANSLGRLGDGTTTQRLVPTPVSGNLTFRQIFNSGINHTCGITIDGGSYCWGYNINGQLGNGTTLNSLVPTKVSADVPFVTLAVNSFRTCGLTANGQAYCWGQEGSNVLTPQPVPFSNRFVSLAIGIGNTCGISTEGVLLCWGSNLGPNFSEVWDEPRAVLPSRSFSQISAVGWGGGVGFCAIDANQVLLCWGNNGDGQAGIVRSSQPAQPQPIAANDRFVSVETGGQHSCALSVSRAIYCWGLNSYGQLANGVMTSAHPPVRVSSSDNFQTISGGITSFTCARDVSFLWLCWGGSAVSLIPITANDLAVVSIGSGTRCGLSSGGAAYCWGNNLNGRLAVGSSVGIIESPLPVVGGNTFQSISSGASHACAVDSGGRAFCWGSNSNGQVGDSTTADRAIPVLVKSDVRFKKVVSGAAHSCGLSDDSRVFCWGSGSLVGDGTTSGNQLTPRQVSSTLAFKDLVAGFRHTCALTSENKALCWGEDLGSGFLGRGDGRDWSVIPHPVAGDLTFSRLFASTNNTCGITPASQLFCWGSNVNGQLGVLLPQSVDRPIGVFSNRTFVDVGVSSVFICGRLASGGVDCWGENTYGNLGGGLPQYLPSIIRNNFSPMVP